MFKEAQKQLEIYHLSPAVVGIFLAKHPIILIPFLPILIRKQMVTSKTAEPNCTR